MNMPSVLENRNMVLDVLPIESYSARVFKFSNARLVDPLGVDGLPDREISPSLLEGFPRSLDQ